MKDLITSSGILRNREKPRVGVISMNSEMLDQDMVNGLPFDNDSIDLSYDSYIAELIEQGATEEAIEEASYCYESDCSTYLIGNAWFRNKDGKYEIDETKDFAATYSSDSGNISVEWSKHTRQCHHTSPCFVMADGSGPCGNLDVKGDAVTAYDLPSEYYKTEVTNE